MKWYVENKLANFEFWSGAIETVSYLTYEEMEQIESILEQEYFEISETEINDLFRFEENTIAHWLGYENFEEIRKERK